MVVFFALLTRYVIAVALAEIWLWLFPDAGDDDHLDDGGNQLEDGGEAAVEGEVKASLPSSPPKPSPTPVAVITMLVLIIVLCLAQPACAVSSSSSATSATSSSSPAAAVTPTCFTVSGPGVIVANAPQCTPSPEGDEGGRTYGSVAVGFYPDEKLLPAPPQPSHEALDDQQQEVEEDGSSASPSSSTTTTTTASSSSSSSSTTLHRHRETSSSFPPCSSGGAGVLRPTAAIPVSAATTDLLNLRRICARWHPHGGGSFHFEAGARWIPTIHHSANEDVEVCGPGVVDEATFLTTRDGETVNILTRAASATLIVLVDGGRTAAYYGSTTTSSSSASSASLRRITLKVAGIHHVKWWFVPSLALPIGGTRSTSTSTSTSSSSSTSTSTSSSAAGSPPPFHHHQHRPFQECFRSIPSALDGYRGQRQLAAWLDKLVPENDEGWSSRRHEGEKHGEHERVRGGVSSTSSSTTATAADKILLHFPVDMTTGKAAAHHV